MASASPFNRPATGLAGRPTRFMGGVRRSDESPDAFRDRMDAGRAGNDTPQAAPLNRRGNIIASRADGSFDGKVAAYNAAGAATGHSMDEAGNLIAPPPKALPLTGTRPAAGTVPMKPATPRGPGLINGQPAAQAIAAVKGPQTAMPMAGAQKPVGGGGFKMPTVADALQPPAVTRNVTSNVTSRVTPPPAAPSLSGGMMPMASRIAQGMRTAMTSTNPSIVLPRAQAIVQTGKQRQQSQQRQPTPATVAPAPSPPARAQNPIASKPPAPPPIATAAPLIPGKTMVANAAKGAAGGLAQSVSTPGRALVTMPVQMGAQAAPLAVNAAKSAVTGTHNALQQSILAPGKVAKSAAEGTVKQVRKGVQKLRNWWETGDANQSPKSASRPSTPPTNLIVGR